MATPISWFNKKSHYADKHRSVGIFVPTNEIISNDHKNYSVQWQEYIVKRHSLQDIYYDNWFRCITTTKLLSDYDVYWFNGKTTNSFLSGLVYYYLHLKEKNFLDPLKYHMLSKDKFYQLINFHHYKMNSPHTLVFNIDKCKIARYVEIAKSSIRFPMIVKGPKWARGDEVFMAQNVAELESLMEIYSGQTILVQEFIYNEWDIRVITIGEKFIWSVHRRNPSGFKNNTSQGAQVSKVEIPTHIQQQCLNFAKKMKLDISGVDIILKWEDVYYIEFNDMPDYNPFQEVVGKDFDHEILHHIHDTIQRDNKNNDNI